MKNIQVIDRGENCIFPIYQATEEEFQRIFPEQGQDIEFIEDFIKRMGRRAAGLILTRIWERPILKFEAMGIHGTLFYEYADRRHHFPDSKRECDLSRTVLNDAQRIMMQRFREREN